ncbi:MAG: sulfatase-like hydrolase/transferase, partial [Candidatus Latescibacteria bacterium]|nr:sulfatase-like hydrolase/transferase [Candidatus Latescibacterota bacterium]
VTEPRVPAAGDAFQHPMSVGMREGFQVDDIPKDEALHARAAYFGGVSYLDEVIGDLLVRLDSDGLLDNTIIVYTSDHGEMAGEHGVWWKNGWYEACTRVPMIISLPGQRSGAAQADHCSVPVGLVDLFPTLCGLAGVETPPGLDGVDLSGVAAGRSDAPDRPVFCDNLIPRWGEGTEFRMIRWRQYKYVVFRDAAPLFFDLKADPGEQDNLIGHTLNVEASAALEHLQSVAAHTMDFDEAQRDRELRDGDLRETYRQSIPESTGNLYHMPSGKLISAEDTLYSPTIIDHDGSEAFGSNWQLQNRKRK